MGTVQKKAKNAAADAKPRHSFDSVAQRARAAADLATKHETMLGKRLNPTFFAAFKADIEVLGDKVPAVITTKDSAVQLTATQTEALDQGYRLVKGIRTTVKGFVPEKDVLLAYGVGTKINKLVVKDVTAGLQKILDRITKQPAEAAAFDLVDDDVTAIKGALGAIDEADKNQGEGLAAAPAATRDRNATARRLLNGIKKIAGIGMRTFPNDATVYGHFEALVTKAGS